VSRHRRGVQATILGTPTNPQVLLRFAWGARHARSGKDMQKWVKDLPGRTFDKALGGWLVTGTGPNPDMVFTEAGFELDFAGIDPASALSGITTLNDLVTPIARLSASGRQVLVRHRFLGYEKTLALLGQGVTWDKVFGRFVLPLTDVLLDGEPRPGFIHDQAAIDAARRVLARVHTAPENKALVQAAGGAATPDDLTAEQMAQLVAINGPIPAWFGLALFPFQEVGAYAVAAGHNGLFDSMRVGKTRTSLAAAALVKSHRTLIISPPLVVTNWAVNAEESRLATRGGKTDGKVVVFKAGKKEPELPETGIVIIADSLVAARPELRKRLAAWKPQATILDEAHREGTYGSKRTEAVLDLGWATEKLAMALTGTPLFSSPTELVPLLEFTGHLGPVFDGVDQFLTEYTTRDKWGRNHPKKSMLPGLRNQLVKNVWVRRTKEQVGIGMPFTHGPYVLDTDMKLFNEAHGDVSDRIDDWLDDYVAAKQEANAEVIYPDDETIEAFASENIGLISGLRRAAGRAKIPGAIELIVDHVKATTVDGPDGRPVFTRPLIVWTHHREVTEAMATALGTAVEESAMIIGGMSMSKKDAVVAAFQRGEIPVIACSIIAAGVGIDLTRSADVIFVETDWTPGNVQQALDRVQGVNQTKNVSAMTLIATGTLDERIQKVQSTKGKTLTAVLGGDHDVSVAENIEDMIGAGDIIGELARAAISKRKARGGPRRAKK
jgi:hypothetical protein